MSDQDRNSPYYIILYNTMQTSDENKEKYQLWDYWLIQYQILQTNITRIIWQIVRRITNDILRVKGLMHKIQAVSMWFTNLCSYDVVTMPANQKKMQSIAYIK